MMEHPIVEKAVRGNEAALEFLRRIAGVLHIWDDLIDRDKKVLDADICGAFTDALITIPSNPFYRAHQDVLLPILANAINNWRIATSLERSEKTVSDLKIAFIIRSSYVDLLTMSALLIGGGDWAAEVGVEVRRWAHQEGFQGYLDNLAAEEAARKENHVL
jgi:hypothetical protein